MITLDEASTIPSFGLHAIDKCLQDITGTYEMFSEKILLLDGDFSASAYYITKEELEIKICNRNF